VTEIPIAAPRLDVFDSEVAKHFLESFSCYKTQQGKEAMSMMNCLSPEVFYYLTTLVEFCPFSTFWSDDDVEYLLEKYVIIHPLDFEKKRGEAECDSVVFVERGEAEFESVSPVVVDGDEDLARSRVVGDFSPIDMSRINSEDFVLDSGAELERSRVAIADVISADFIISDTDGELIASSRVVAEACGDVALRDSVLFYLDECDDVDSVPLVIMDGCDDVDEASLVIVDTCGGADCVPFITSDARGSAKRVPCVAIPRETLLLLF